MKKAGFTLIELMVVIVIVGILFAVALPVFENAGKKDTRRAAQQVVNTLRLARQHAISRRQWTLVVFPNQDSNYTDYAKDIVKIIMRESVGFRRDTLSKVEDKLRQ